jgi:hypothetical protein
LLKKPNRPSLIINLQLCVFIKCTRVNYRLVSLNDIAPASAPDNNDEMKRIGLNWAQTHATLFAGSKRKRVNENATEEPDSKRSAADGDTKKTLMEEEKNVVKIPPIANCSWYLGVRVQITAPSTVGNVSWMLAKSS